MSVLLGMSYEAKCGSFSFLPPSTFCAPRYRARAIIVNHYVKIWHVHLGGAINMRPLSWGGGGSTNGKDPQFYLQKKTDFNCYQS